MHLRDDVSETAEREKRTSFHDELFMCLNFILCKMFFLLYIKITGLVGWQTKMSLTSYSQLNIRHISTNIKALKKGKGEGHEQNQSREKKCLRKLCGLPIFEF